MLDKKAVFINTASQILVRFTTMVFTLISVKLLANYLGVAGLGKYNTITTYINFFIVIADLGLFAVTVREISKNPDREKTIISNVLWIRIASSFLACVVAFGIIASSKYRTDPDILYGTLIATGFLFFNLLGSVYDMILQYRLKMQFSALAEFLSKLLSIIALILIVHFRGNFLWVTATIALSGLFIFFFKWLFSVKYVQFNPKYNKEVASWIFNLAWPLGIIFIINGLFFKLDTLMLYVIKGPEPVGIYSNAYKILEVTIIFGSYYASALKPTISKHISEDKAYVGDLIKKSINIMIFIAAPIMVACLVFPKEIIVFLSNKDFIEGSKALIILAFSLPVMYLDILLSEILIANDERKLFIKIATFILGFNFLFNLIFIPKYSFMGAAVGTLISEILLFSVNLRYTKKITNYRIDWRALLKITLVSLISLIFGLIIKNTIPVYFLFLVFLTLAFFAGCCFLFKIINLRLIKSIFS